MGTPTVAPKRSERERKWFFTREHMLFAAGKDDEGKQQWETIKRGTKCYWVKPSADDLDYIRKQHAALGRQLLTVKLCGMKRFIERDQLMPMAEWEAKREQLRAEGYLSEES